MSGECGNPFEEDELEHPAETDFKAALEVIRSHGWTPLAIVVPEVGRFSSKVHALALEHALNVVVDPDRDPEAGIGIQYEGEAPNLEAAKPAEDQVDQQDIDRLLDDGGQGDAWRG